MKLGEFQRLMIQKLRTAGADESALAVRLLLENRLSLAPLTLPLHAEREVDAQKQKQLTDDMERLISGEPLQYILGTQAFWDLTVTVRPGVLIPRPETEELAQEAVRYLALTEKRRVLDLCTGSGALALAVKKHVPDADVTGTDLSPDALRIAKENAQALSLDITWTEGDLWDGTEGMFDLVICNPPYIPTSDVEALDRTVRAYEPRMALDGGPDGLSFYRRIAGEAPEHIEEGGALFLEVGAGQAADVQAMLAGGFKEVRIRKDMEGIERMVLATGRKE